MQGIGVAIAFLQGLFAGQGIPGELTPVGDFPGHYYVQHGDPYVIVMLLMGQSPPFPEMSTARIIFGGQFATQQQNGRWFIPEGTLMVNPADNSIWYIPKKG